MYYCVINFVTVRTINIYKIEKSKVFNFGYKVREKTDLSILKLILDLIPILNIHVDQLEMYCGLII